MHVSEQRARQLGWSEDMITCGQATCMLVNLRNRNARKKRRANAPTREERREAQHAIKMLEEN